MKHHFQRNLGYLLIGIGLLPVVFGSYEFIRRDVFRAHSRVLIPYVMIPRLAIDGAAHISNIQELQNDEWSKVASASVKEGLRAITTDVILSNVVSKLDLTSKWSSPTQRNQKLSEIEAMDMLRGMISARIVPNAMIAEISVDSESSNEAVEIANTIAEVYQDWQLFKLHSEYQDYGKKVRDAETELKHLQETLKIPAPEPSMSELRTNYPAFYQTKQDLNFYKECLRRSSEETSIQVGVEKAVPPAALVRRKKRLSIILLVAGLGCCLWGLMATRDAKLTAKT